jgi:hypothetical protein
MHLSQGQISFLVAFAAAFIVTLIWAYRKDKPTDRKYYTGVWKILISLIVILAAISYILRHFRK